MCMCKIGFCIYTTLNSSRGADMAINGFTKTETKILELLSDDRAHTREEIHSCLPDELGELGNIHTHIMNIRKKIRPIGQDIRYEQLGTKRYYRLVRTLASPYGE